MSQNKDQAMIRVIKNTRINNKCLEFIGYRHRTGYGLIKYDKDPTPRVVHRLMYEQLIGPIPQDMVVCHTCDNPPCWNPRHLFLGTTSDNMKDMTSKGRNYLTYGPKNGNCKLSSKQVEDIRKDSRSLRIISTEYGVRKSTISMIKNFKSRKYQ